MCRIPIRPLARNRKLDETAGMPKHPSLSGTLKSQSKKNPKADRKTGKLDGRMRELQLRLLTIQQAVFHQKARVVIVFEGFDASGKGGAIRRMTEGLDPRGIQVHPIGPPTAREQGIHYLYRFWTKLPPPGTIAVFDRSWYGRVLVERVEKLVPNPAWKRAYDEIREFERVLVDDGISLIKVFIAVSKKEQLMRFEERLHNPYKQWKLSLDDIRARSQWDKYVEAADELLERTDTYHCPWHVVEADDKHRARLEVLETIVSGLAHHEKWMQAKKGLMPDEKEIRKAMKSLGKT